MTMPKILATGMAVAFAGALAGNAFAQTPAKSPAAPKTTASKSTSKSAAAKPAAHTASGTIESYDATAHSLTIKGAKASSTFDVGMDTKVWSGSKSVTVDELSSDTGRKATVKYTEADGKKTASSVRVAAAASTKTKTTTKAK